MDDELFLFLIDKALKAPSGHNSQPWKFRKAGDSCIEILPDFEHKVFQGRFAVGGKVKVSHISCVAWRLFWNKDVRSSYKDIKNFEW